MSDYVHIDVKEIKRETENALLVELEDDTIWIPKSQISDVEDYEEGDKDLTLSVTEWIAKQKGLV